MQTQQRFFAPEVVQTSEMDCGPAALKCLLEGFGISASYGRLREVCQTDVDGASIDTLEEVAIQLGLRAEQILLPADHLLLPAAEALPALVVTQQPNGTPHFVVVWNVVGGWVQVMDPAMGRQWISRQQFLQRLYQHIEPVPIATWRAWAESTAFCEPLRQRLLALRVAEPRITELLDQAHAADSWHPLATLDAVTRLVATLVQTGGVWRGVEAQALLDQMVATTDTSAIPDLFWSVRPVPAEPGPASPTTQLLMQGAVLVRVRGRRVPAEVANVDESSEPPTPTPALAPMLALVLTETPSQPTLHILQALRADNLLTPMLLGFALLLATIGITFEAALLRGLLAINQQLDVVGARVQLLAAVLFFALMLMLLEIPISINVLRLGRRLETRLRMAFLAKIPRLSERYFHSRLTSDMAQRAHDLRQLRTLPDLGVQFLRLSFQIILTAGGIIWLAPRSAGLVLLAAVLMIGLTLLFQPLLAERDLRVRAHNSTLVRFYLDAMLGLLPIRTHSAARVVRREQERMLVAWVRANWAVFRLQTAIETTSALVGAGFVIWIVLDYLAHGADKTSLLLLLYWLLNLPVLGLALLEIAKQYPVQRNHVLKLLEPLGAPEEGEEDKEIEKQGEEHAVFPPGFPSAHGVAITIENVTVQASGHTILEGINLTIQPGEQIAIVGPSGAGKSSLIGLLLGWHQPAAGHVLINGTPLTGENLAALRRATAWVDPGVQIWNRSLVDNLRYGVENVDLLSLEHVIETADLFQVLEKLPDGLQTSLGEGGGLVSGGEGQRVRLGRALLRPDVQLVILDEPFRGLDRTKRHALLAQARQHWPDCTLLCITHDVQETQSFARVLVIEEGRVVEDGPPTALAAQQNSRYHALLSAETAVRQGLWAQRHWRRLWLENGHLQENRPNPAS